MDCWGHDWKWLHKLGNQWHLIALHALLKSHMLPFQPAHVLQTGKNSFELYWLSRAGVTKLL